MKIRPFTRHAGLLCAAIVVSCIAIIGAVSVASRGGPWWPAVGAACLTGYLLFRNAGMEDAR